MAHLARTGSVRSKREAFLKGGEEMLEGMLAMTPAERVEDVELLRKRFYFIASGANELPAFVYAVRVADRRNG